MKTATLPICIPSLPSLDASPEIWRQVAPILQAIAEREQRRKLSSDRAIATNALFVAQYLSYKHQWSSLWQSLLDRDVLHIGDAPKLQPPKPRPEIEAQVIAPIAPPPKPKSDRPKNKPPKNATKPKNVAPKKKAPRKRDRLREYHRLVFAALKPSLIRLQVFLWFADWLAYIAPLCPRRLQGWKLSDRPKTLRAKPKFTKQRKSLKGIPLECARIVPTNQLMAVLTDKWLDIASIRDRFDSMFGVKLTLAQAGDLLNNRLCKGEIYKMPKGTHDAAFYSKIEAVEIDTEHSTKYISLKMAHELAQSRGYPYIRKSFGNASENTLAKYGIGFKPRKEMSETDNKLLNYFDIRRDIQV